MYDKKGEGKSGELEAPKLQTVLDFIESKININIVNDFKRSFDGLWNGEEKYRELYHLWRSLTDDERSYSTIGLDPTSLIPITVSEVSRLARPYLWFMWHIQE